MKKSFLLILHFTVATFTFSQTEYKLITTVESIVPGGMGRSRIINHEQEANYLDFTTERTDGKKSTQSDIKRGDVKIDALEETKLLNFYSLTGINLQNIASNDAIISSKINSMVKEGWDLAFVVGGVESDAGAGDGDGIFVTRFIFKRDIKPEE